MKRLLAIALVAILLLNTMGYYAVFLGIGYSQDEALIKVLNDGAYNESNTVTLKIPITVAYMPDQKEFERVDGRFEYNGVHYRLVKQKYAGDTLTIVCIVDHEKKALEQQLSNYVKTFTDQAADQSGNIAKTITFIKDYLPQFTSIQSSSFGWAKNMRYPDYANNLIATFESSIVHPPERRG